MIEPYTADELLEAHDELHEIGTGWHEPTSDIGMRAVYARSNVDPEALEALTERCAPGMAEALVRVALSEGYINLPVLVGTAVEFGVAVGLRAAERRNERV